MVRTIRVRKTPSGVATALLLSFAYPLFFNQVACAKKEAAIYDLPLDQLVNIEVVSASRFKQKSSEAPSAVEIVTADDIRNYGWRTLADALNAMRGLYTRNDRNYSYLGNRGFLRTGDYNTRVLIMIDGRRMNDAVYDQGFISEEFMLDMNLIERIEFIPGSGSSVYGANALLGVINVITKNGKNFNGLKLSGEAGSFDTYRARVTYGKQWDNGADFLINGSHYFSHGPETLFFPEFSNTQNGVAQNMDLERNDRVFGKLSYGGLTLQGGYMDRYKRIPTASFGAIFNDKGYFTKDQNAYIDLDYNTQINSKLGLEVRAFHHWSSYYGDEPIEIKGRRIINRDGSRSRWWGGEIKLTSLHFRHHKLVAGLEVQKDEQQHQYNYDINPYQFNSNTNRSGWRTGVYLQDEYRITDSLLLNIGGRLDYHHMINEIQMNPRVGLIWDMTPTLTAKLLYSSAFRPPNAFEKDYLAADFGLQGNPNAEAELIKSYEAVAEWYPGNGYKALGTVFYNNLEKVLVANNDSGSPNFGMYQNSGHYQTLGFELGLEKHWNNGRLLKLTWMHNYTRDTDGDEVADGGWALDSPKNLVKFHYAEPFFNDTVFLGFEELFVDGRRTFANNIAPSYHLFNINLAMAKPLYGFKASLGLYNVLDQQYKVLGGSEHKQDTLAMDGRTVRFRLEYGF